MSDEKSYKKTGRLSSFTVQDEHNGQNQNQYPHSKRIPNSNQNSNLMQKSKEVPFRTKSSRRDSFEQNKYDSISPNESSYLNAYKSSDSEDYSDEELRYIREHGTYRNKFSKNKDYSNLSLDKLSDLDEKKLDSNRKRSNNNRQIIQHPSNRPSPPSPLNPTNPLPHRSLQFIENNSNLNYFQNYFLSLISIQIHITLRLFIILIVIPILYMTYVYVPHTRYNPKNLYLNHQQNLDIYNQQSKFNHTYVYSTKTEWTNNFRMEMMQFTKRQDVSFSKGKKKHPYYEGFDKNYTEEIEKKHSNRFNLRKLFPFTQSLFRKILKLFSPSFYIRIFIRLISKIILSCASVIYSIGIIAKNLTLEIIGGIVASIIILWPVLVKSNTGLKRTSKSPRGFFTKCFYSICSCICLPCECTIYMLNCLFTSCFIFCSLFIFMGAIISITIGFSSDILWIPFVSSFFKSVIQDYTQTKMQPKTLEFPDTPEILNYLQKIASFPKLLFANTPFTPKWFFHFIISLLHVLRFYAYCGISASIIMIIIVSCERGAQCWRWMQRTKRKITSIIIDEDSDG